MTDERKAWARYQEAEGRALAAAEAARRLWELWQREQQKDAQQLKILDLTGALTDD